MCCMYDLKLMVFHTVPCWITVSPPMCVTGNMASNMSLREKRDILD